MLEFHHIGILVDDIESAVENYKGLFEGSSVDGPYEIVSQGVKVCFLSMDKGHLEFVEGIGDSSILDVMKKRKVKYYHVGYLVRDVDATIDALCCRNHRHVSTFSSEAFAGRKCAFLFSPEMHLIELIEKAP